MNDHDAYLTRGMAAAKARDKKRARRLLTQAVQRHPDSAEAWLWLGYTLTTPQGRIFCLRRALALESSLLSAPYTNATRRCANSGFAERTIAPSSSHGPGVCSIIPLTFLRPVPRACTHRTASRT